MLNKKAKPVKVKDNVSSARLSTEDLSVKEWKDTEELKEARRRGGIPSRYARSGTPELEDVEEKVATLLGLECNRVAVYNYGMTAVVAALEYWRPRAGLIAVHGHNEYTRTKQYFSEILVSKGVIPEEVSSYSIEGLSDAIRKYRPQIVFLETIGNGPDIPILDVKRFLSIPGLKDPGLLTVLDNTLAADRIRPEELIENDLNIIVVESGTKFYTKNRSSVGFAYAKDPRVVERLKLLRTITGGAPDRIPAKLLNNDIISPKEFADRNNRIFTNAKILAESCSSVLLRDSAFSVSYPNLAGHPESEFANKNYPGGAAPLFFLRTKGNINQYALTDALFSAPVIKAACLNIESFGFDFTAIYPNDYTPLDSKGKEPYVRISAGTEDADVVMEIGGALRHVLGIVSGISGG